MKRGGKQMLICVLGGFAATTNLATFAGEASEGRYHGIVERNVFNLKPPPPAVPPEPPPAPPPKITLTGITTILGGKKALMKVSVPAKPPEPAKDESHILGETEREADIEVVQIDETQGTVIVKNHGTTQTIDFKNDGAKQVAVAAPPPPPPGLPPPAGIPPPPAPNAPGAPAGTTRTIPPRTMRLPNAPGTPGASGASVQVNPMNQAVNVPQGSSEEQIIMMEAQRLRYQMEGNPAANIMPPTTRGNPVKQGEGGPGYPTARP